MKNSDIKKNNIKEVGLYGGVIVLTIAAFFLTYYFTFSAPIIALIWIAWLLLCGVLMYFTSVGQKTWNFAKEAKIELLKVVWPTRQETIQTTSIVIIMVTVAGFILWGLDTVMIWSVAKITHLG